MNNVMVWVMAGTLVLATGEGLQAQSPEGESGQPFDVHLRNLESKKTDFEKLVMEELNPQRSEIRETFKKTIHDLDDHLVALRKDPNDEARKAAYEETLSLAITQAMGFLGDYQQLEGRTMSRIGQMSDALRDAREACLNQEKASQKEVAEYQERSVAVRQKLEELARNFADVIQRDGTLPPDVELDVRLLEADLTVAEQTAAFAEIAQQDMRLTANDLHSQMAELTELKGSLKVRAR